ncbi:MAG TPA: class I SAM-dependent methyltransferase, partial [Terriglobia bacterium]|nr:class I SAM-dependent methyltransferase [Terriglobia bacterium]
MINITHPEIEKYLEALLPPRDEVLAEMEALAARDNIPIIGPVVGRIFYLLIRLHRARRIFEMGSAIGYSTLWAARAAGAGAAVYYSDGDPHNAARAAEFLRRAGVEDRVRILTGDALELLDQTPGEFDVIFCDVDKHQYPDAFRKAAPRLRR